MNPIQIFLDIKYQELKFCKANNLETLAKVIEQSIDKTMQNQPKNIQLTLL